MEPTMKHRIRAAGILIQNESILLIKHVQNGESWWVPPGGGYETEDDDTQATVVREVKEEAGLTVLEMGPLVYIREYKEASLDTFHMEQFRLVAQWEGTVHLNNLQGLGGDEHIIQEARFVPKDELHSITVYPAELRDDIWTRIKQQPISAVHLGTFSEEDGNSA
jgi:ADP-ribose pyrophosphatase YjhB (NUDIX family)